MWCEKVLRNLTDPGHIPPAGEIDFVDVAWDECKSILKKQSRAGEPVRVLLNRTEKIRHGDVLAENESRAIVVNVVPCEVVVVRSDEPRRLAELAFELGNLHWPAQVSENELAFVEESSAMQAVRACGLEFVRERRRFDPLPVAVTLGFSVSQDLRVLRRTAPQGGGAAARSDAKSD